MKKLRCPENKWSSYSYILLQWKITQITKKKQKWELKYNRCICHNESPVGWESEEPGSGLGFAINYLSNYEQPLNLFRLVSSHVNHPCTLKIINSLTKLHFWNGGDKTLLKKHKPNHRYFTAFQSTVLHLYFFGILTNGGSNQWTSLHIPRPLFKLAWKEVVKIFIYYFSYI